MLSPLMMSIFKWCDSIFPEKAHQPFYDCGGVEGHAETPKAGNPMPIAKPRVSELDSRYQALPAVANFKELFMIIFTETEMKDQLEKKKAKLNEKIQKIIDAAEAKIQLVKAEIEKLDAVIDVMIQNGL